MVKISRSALDGGDLETKWNLEREERFRDRGLSEESTEQKT